MRTVFAATSDRATNEAIARDADAMGCSRTSPTTHRRRILGHGHAPPRTAHHCGECRRSSNGSSAFAMQSPSASMPDMATRWSLLRAPPPARGGAGRMAQVRRRAAGTRFSPWVRWSWGRSARGWRHGGSRRWREPQQRPARRARASAFTSRDVVPVIELLRARVPTSLKGVASPPAIAPRCTSSRASGEAAPAVWDPPRTPRRERQRPRVARRDRGSGRASLPRQAAGMDSMVVGEAQIHGRARCMGSTPLGVGCGAQPPVPGLRRARRQGAEETRIGHGGYECQLRGRATVQEDLGGLAGRCAAVLGAGDGRAGACIVPAGRRAHGGGGQPHVRARRGCCGAVWCGGGSL